MAAIDEEICTLCGEPPKKELFTREGKLIEYRANPVASVARELFQLLESGHGGPEIVNGFTVEDFERNVDSLQRVDCTGAIFTGYASRCADCAEPATTECGGFAGNPICLLYHSFESTVVNALRSLGCCFVVGCWLAI